MKYTSLFVIVCITLLASCGDSRKNVLVLGNSGMEVNSIDHKISTKGESGHDEKMVEFGTGKLHISIASPSGKKEVSISDKGAYVLNAKYNDTIIGGFQNYSVGNNTGSNEVTVISQQEVIKKIDSLEQLIQGKNISAANRNFYIKPFEAIKISDNPDAVIVAPFHKMSYVEAHGDKAPEVYRFYTINEIREIVAKLKETTK